MAPLLIVLVLHWLFDFVFQSRKIANEKWHDLKALTDHASIYGLGLLCMAFPLNWFINDSVQLGVFVFTNGLSHLMIDYLTSKATHVLSVEKLEKQFWCTIGFDQLLHLSILVITMHVFLGLV